MNQKTRQLKSNDLVDYVRYLDSLVQMTQARDTSVRLAQELESSSSDAEKLFKSQISVLESSLKETRSKLEKVLSDHRNALADLAKTKDALTRSEVDNNQLKAELAHAHSNDDEVQASHGNPK